MSIHAYLSVKFHRVNCVGPIDLGFQLCPRLQREHDSNFIMSMWEQRRDVREQTGRMVNIGRTSWSGEAESKFVTMAWPILITLRFRKQLCWLVRNPPRSYMEKYDGYQTADIAAHWFQWRFSWCMVKQYSRQVIHLPRSIHSTILPSSRSARPAWLCIVRRTSLFLEFALPTITWPLFEE